MYRTDPPKGPPRFVRMVVHAEQAAPVAESTEVSDLKIPKQPVGRGGVDSSHARVTQEIRIHDDVAVDWTLDSAMYGLWAFGMYAPDDPRIVSMMTILHDRLWCKTDVGGMARYENDYYQQVSQDIDNVPGNPWFICTLWMAQYYIAAARTLADLEPAVAMLEWTAAHALDSDILAEQVNPYTHAPLSVSPLTWSHATVITAVHEYLDKYAELVAAGAATATPPADSPKESS